MTIHSLPSDTHCLPTLTAFRHSLPSDTHCLPTLTAFDTTTKVLILGDHTLTASFSRFTTKTLNFLSLSNEEIKLIKAKCPLKSSLIFFLSCAPAIYWVHSSSIVFFFGPALPQLLRAIGRKFFCGNFFFDFCGPALRQVHSSSLSHISWIC
jgi:hypothetical protein